MYLVCFDLSKPLSAQQSSIFFWLNFIYSARFFPSDNWSLLLVGLKSDLLPATSPRVQLPQESLTVWKKMWPKLPISDQIVYTSATTSSESVQKLILLLESKCSTTFSQFSIRVPSVFQRIWKAIQMRSTDSNMVTKDELYDQSSNGLDSASFTIALQYLHDIGEIVLLSSGVVFTNPAMAAKMMAEFVAHPDARQAAMMNRSQGLRYTPTGPGIMQVSIMDEWYQ